MSSNLFSQLIFVGSHTLSFTLNTGLIASNYAGNTKKTTASGLIFAGWAAGLIAGPRKFETQTEMRTTAPMAENL